MAFLFITIWLYLKVIALNDVVCLFLSDYREDIVIECDTLPSLLRNTVFWKGILFAPSSDQNNESSIEYVDVFNAGTAIDGSGRSFRFTNITVKGGLRGFNLENLTKSLVISESFIGDTQMDGIRIASQHIKVVIDKTVVQNVSRGSGMTYKELSGSIDLCTLNVEPSSYPLALKASGKSAATECTKVCLRTCYVYFRLPLCPSVTLSK